MESPDLNPSTPDDTTLDACLRGTAWLPPLPDDGFSRRVLARLPEPRRQTALRRNLCLAATAAGLAVAVIGGLRAGNAAGWDRSLHAALQQVGTWPVSVALGVTLLSLWFAFRDRLRLLPRP
jgi:hypothetical protein